MHTDDLLQAYSIKSVTARDDHRFMKQVMANGTFQVTHIVGVYEKNSCMALSTDVFVM